jgi:hypothetical protein
MQSPSERALFCFLILSGRNRRDQREFYREICHHTLGIKIKKCFHYHSVLQGQLKCLKSCCHNIKLAGTEFLLASHASIWLRKYSHTLVR